MEECLASDSCGTTSTPLTGLPSAAVAAASSLTSAPSACSPCPWGLAAGPKGPCRARPGVCGLCACEEASFLRNLEMSRIHAYSG
jgi:hypothetical protein